jgi:hypothetical protein
LRASMRKARSLFDVRTEDIEIHADFFLVSR